jgi:acetyltransferase-like isoleucine patch superfamily enzyme
MTLSDQQSLRQRISERIYFSLLYGRIGRFIRDAAGRHPLYLAGRLPNPQSRVTIGEGSLVANAVFNVASGGIAIGRWVMLAQDVMLLAATHDFAEGDQARQDTMPREGYDIVIEDGAFIGARAVVIGPCRIGRNAVVGAGAVVTRDVEAGMIVAGVPARSMKAAENYNGRQGQAGLNAVISDA